MLYNSTKTLLQSIVQSIETGDHGAWDDQIESLRSCLYEMHQMSRPVYRAYKTDGQAGKAPVQQPVSERLNQAVPHVKSMLTAVRKKDAAAALTCGRAALAVM
ncbi:MAG: hypothetical protein U0Q18_01460 [Bryobacteraceae bacterium]